MFKVLVVDDDATCLTVARACLRRYDYYEVVAVTHALEVLSLLDENRGEEKSYDLILADVHMPIIDGYELLRHDNKNFNIPVVLISADDKSEAMWKGHSHGAPAYLLKPIKIVDMKYLWQYSVLWKNKEKNSYKRFHHANVPKKICSYSGKKTNELVWSTNLHNRFVEAILILGPTKAVPKTVLEVMNVPLITREQVASHLQKFRKFMKKVLERETSLDNSNSWIDCTYYSGTIGGNPNVILLNKLQEMRCYGKMPDPIPASLPLPIFNETGGEEGAF
ncbi:two-component response regulator ORR21-like [Apium graveolens]|uniref:two-component response regulator ORR21-like n=1 Tax=Apium graveolens TaxID=4045 RepID=UPI003D7B7767